ncbi:MAG TPA: hypothetical protein VGP58_13675 [Pyrinomonadaceae bacterium]|nr:hypothetical protein [Pyrinomonadaceae bacterium]
MKQIAAFELHGKRLSIIRVGTTTVIVIMVCGIMRTNTASA